MRLIHSLFAGDEAGLLYEGTDSSTGIRMRVGEFITVNDGKIARIQASISVGA